MLTEATTSQHLPIDSEIFLDTFSEEEGGQRQHIGDDNNDENDCLWFDFDIEVVGAINVDGHSGRDEHSVYSEFFADDDSCLTFLVTTI